MLGEESRNLPRVFCVPSQKRSRKQWLKSTNKTTFVVLVCCRPSRPGRFMVFVQMEKYSWGRWDVRHAFLHRWASHTLCKLHVCLPVSCHGPCSPAWHPSGRLSLCLPFIIICPQQGVPTGLSTRAEQSRQGARNYIT